MKEPLPLLIAGATGVGKSALALQLANLLRGEIISVDSMQVYHGLDIGTAKPSLAERKSAPHHLIDIRTLTESFDAAAFVREAEIARQAIVDRGRVPIFCGGTGLYFKAWIEGLGTAPPADAALRVQLEKMPLPDLWVELERCDPKLYHSIDLQNKRRLIRAVEVIRLTGQPFSAQRANWKSEAEPRAAFAIALERENADSHRRIETRVDQMFARGLVAEVRELLPQLRLNRTAAQAIGYKQLIDHFEGKLDLAATIELVKIKTRQFAKRQRTWFKQQMRLQPIALAELSDASQIAEIIAERYGRASRS